jgi:hypothetical protein
MIFLLIAGKITKSQLLQYLISRQFKYQKSYLINEQEMFIDSQIRGNKCKNLIQKVEYPHNYSRIEYCIIIPSDPIHLCRATVLPSRGSVCIVCNDTPCTNLKLYTRL